MNKFNIVIVNDYANITGGADKVAIVSAIALAEKGHSVYFFSPVGPICEQLKNSNVKVVCLNQNDMLHNKNRLEAIFQGIWNKKAKLEFEKLLEKLKNEYTIVHFHSYTKALSTSVIRAAIDKKAKTLLTLHDYYTVCPNGGLYNFKTETICKLTPMSKKCILCNCDSRKYLHKIWRVLRQRTQIKKGLLPSNIKNHIYISQLSKNILQPYLPEDSKLYYVKNPVDIEKEMPVNVRQNKKIVFIGRLNKEKGCLLFAKVAEKLKLNAVFIGDGELKDEVMKIYPKARITGWVDKNQINMELKSARALVFSSLLYETLGLSAAEAQAKGVPVIVSDTCAAREVVKNKETGLWFKRGNLDDLEEKIKIMLNDDAVETYGKNAYNFYWENDYSLENHINQLVKVYEDILERG